MPAARIPPSVQPQTSGAKVSVRRADNNGMMNANGERKDEVVMLRLTTAERRKLERLAAQGHRTVPGHLRYLLALADEREAA